MTKDETRDAIIDCVRDNNTRVLFRMLWAELDALKAHQTKGANDGTD